MMADTKQRNQRIVLAVLVVIAAMVWYFGFGRSGVGNTTLSAAQNYQPINAQDYGVVFKQLGITQKTEYKSNGRNIFTMMAVPVVTPGATQAAKAARTPTGPMPPPPPPPATLPMKFFGYGSLPSNGPRLAFLLDGEEVRIVSEGETVLNHIRITHIGNDRIEFVDTLTGQHGSNNLEANPAA
jgi:hypothetical protein